MDRKPSQLETEIFEQPQTLGRLLDQEWENVESIAQEIHNCSPNCIVIAARGSSDNVARYSQYLLGSITGLPVALATPSLLTVYKRPLHYDKALVIGISQSGQSPDVVSVLSEGNLRGGLTLAVSNDLESPLATVAQHSIGLHTGTEESIAATKTYTASLTAMAMLAAALFQKREHFQDIEKLPEFIERITSSGQEYQQAAERYQAIESCVVISRGYNYATAFEIALKLKELAYVLAEPYSSADFQHGPVALVEGGFPIIAIIAEGPMAVELIDLSRQLKKRGAELIVISAFREALDLAQTPLELPDGIPEWLSPVANAVVGQLFTLGLTIAKGLDPDHPRGLRKVTRTR
jgi:glucosamine--fructose-6-phosphate aminotransferase (isomerizing)